MVMIVDMVLYRATVGTFCGTHTGMKLTVKNLVVTVHTTRLNNKKILCSAQTVYLCVL